MAQRTCAKCKSDFTSPYRNRPRKYCFECRPRRRDAGPRVAEVNEHGTVTGYGQHRNQGDPPCDPCREAWNARCREQQAAARARGWRRPTRTAYQLTCERCGVEFRAESRKQRFCSQRCWGKATRKTSDELVHVGPKISEAPAVQVTVVTTPRWWRVLVSGPCAWCGSNFTGTGSTTVYCSKRCARAAGKARHLTKTGRFAVSTSRRRRLYARDGWTCQLCFEPVDRDADPLSDWAPSLDHIEPQSHALIPDHSDENLRTAHRWCNAVRGDGTYHADFFEEAS